MSLLSEIYPIIKKLKFFINGHDNLENEFNEFYKELIQIHSLKNNKNLKFLSGAHVPLGNDKNQRKPLYDILSQWQTLNFDKLFFYSFDAADSHQVLSFYFYLLKREIKDNSFSIIFSRYFNDDYDVRFQITDDKLKIELNNRENVIDFFIPDIIFSEKVRKNKDFKQLFRELIGTNENVTKYLVDLPNEEGLYKVLKGNDLNENELLSLFEEIFDTKETNIKLQQEFKRQLNLFLKLHPGLISNDQSIYKAFTHCLIAVSFICKYFSCSTEYFLGVAGRTFDPHEPQKIRYRNLGGLIAGYDINHPMETEERMIFNLISDRLSSISAAMALVELDIKFKIISYREKFLRLYNYIDKDETKNNFSYIAHGTDNFQYDNEFKKSVFYYVPKDLISIFDSYWETFFKERKYFSKYLFVINSEVAFKSDKFSNLEKQVFLIKDDTSDQYKTRLGNYPKIMIFPILWKFFDTVIKVNKSADKYNDYEIRQQIINLKNYGYEKKENVVIVSISYRDTEKFNFKNLINNLRGIKHGGSLASSIINLYAALLAHGDFIFYGKDETKEPIFSLREIGVFNSKVEIPEHIIKRVENLPPQSELNIYFINKLEVGNKRQ